MPVTIDPARKSGRPGTLMQKDAAVYTGEEVNDCHRVAATHGDGGLDKLLVSRR